MASFGYTDIGIGPAAINIAMDKIPEGMLFISTWLKVESPGRGADKRVWNFIEPHIRNTWITITYWYQRGMNRLSPSAPRQQWYFKSSASAGLFLFHLFTKKLLYFIPASPGKLVDWQILSYCRVKTTPVISFSPWHPYNIKTHRAHEYCPLLILCKEKPDTFSQEKPKTP